MLRRCLLALGLVACAAPIDDSSATTDDLTLGMPGVDESSLDRSIDPCDDFYQFACGGYLARPLDPAIKNPTFSSGRRAFLELTVRADEIIDTIVHEPPVSGAEAKLQATYRSCMAVTRDDFVAMAAEATREIRAVASAADLARVTARASRSGMPRLVGTEVSDVKGKLQPVLWPGLANIHYATDEGIAHRAAYFDRVLEAALVDLPPDARAAMSKDAALAEQMLWDDNPSEWLPEGESLDAAKLSTFAPSFDWQTYLGEMGFDHLTSWRPAQLAVVERVLGANLDFAKNYLVAQTAALLASRLPLADDPHVRDEACKSTLMNDATAAVLPRFFELAGLDDAARQKARAMFEAIRASFDQELAEATLFDDATRREARAKLAATRVEFGDTVQDDLAGFTPVASYEATLEALHTRDFEQRRALIGKPPPAEVEASKFEVFAGADSSANQATVTPAMMGGLFFSKNASKLANFAALGMTFGHEIGHEFDLAGSQTDAQGNDRNWWSPSSKAELKSRAHCLVDEFGATTIPENGANVDGHMTILENMADNVGLRVAYRAAMTAARGRTAALASGFTPAQQFFIGNAQPFCAKLTAEQMTSIMEYESHAPARARINVGAMNFDKFAEAFSCQAGTKMNPPNRCVVY